MAAAWLLPLEAVLAQGEREPAGNPKPKPGEAAKPTIPRDLIVDEHLREEYGVTELTTPSIKKVFEQLRQNEQVAPRGNAVSIGSRLLSGEDAVVKRTPLRKLIGWVFDQIV